MSLEMVGILALILPAQRVRGYPFQQNAAIIGQLPGLCRLQCTPKVITALVMGSLGKKESHFVCSDSGDSSIHFTQPP